MTEKELREFWARLVGDIGDKDEGEKVTIATVAKTLKEGAHDVFQHLFNLGHSEATKRAEKAAGEAKTALEEKDRALAEKETELAAAKMANPGSTERVRELEGQVQALQGEKKQLEKDHRAKLRDVTQEAQVSALRARMAGKLDPDWADVQVQKKEIKARIRVNDDGTVDVLQPDGKIPYAATEGKDGFDLLVDEIVKGAKSSERTSKFVLAETDSGSGTGAGQGGPTGGTKDAKFYDDLRERAKAENSVERPEGFKTGAERLGVSELTR